MRGEYSMQPRGVDHDDLIEALTSDRADDAFRLSVLHGDSGAVRTACMFMPR